MLVSISDYLEQNGIMPCDTVYLEEEKEILEHPMILGEFLSVEKRGNEYEQFDVSIKLRAKIEAYKSEDEILLLLQTSIGTILELTKSIKMSCDARDNKYLQEIREAKKIISEICSERVNEIENECLYEYFGRKQKLSEKVIWYKRTVYLTSIRNLSASVSSFSHIERKELRSIPLFSTRMDDLRKAMEQNRPIGVEGGPCLYSYDEVIIEVIHSNGTVRCFDFTGPNHYEMDLEETVDLAEFVLKYKNEIVDIKFHNKKRAITRCEFYGLLYVFEIAKAFDAKAIIPIVDLSYEKYIRAVCENLNEELRMEIVKAFEVVLYEISDLFLGWIEKLKGWYPQVEVELLHKRDRNSCGLFYESREPYLNRYKKLDEMTTNESKRESVIDYVTMPALPFYRWGIRDIIQVDCISELDSYRKCKKIHGKEFQLYGLFYSESLSLDQTFSDYSARFEKKDYILMESYHFNK